jgi:hypothetical protein
MRLRSVNLTSYLWDRQDATDSRDREMTPLGKVGRSIRRTTLLVMIDTLFILCEMEKLIDSFVREYNNNQLLAGLKKQFETKRS